MWTCNVRTRRGGGVANVAGFTYLGLLIFIAVTGLASATSLTVGALAQRRSAEQELLFVGGEFRDAFRSYYVATPIGQQPYPNTLDELVEDMRFPLPVRHLRKIYADPITARADWIVIEAPIRGIMGVRSKSEAQPIKIGNFSDADSLFEGKTRYSDWEFLYQR